MKTIRYWVILLVIVYGSVEIFSYSSLYFIKIFTNIEDFVQYEEISDKQKYTISQFIENKIGYYSFSRTLGWTIKPNGVSRLYQANSSGQRGDREYSLSPPDNVLRISTFGDSFTHGDDVGNESTWQAFMEGELANVEVINFGVGGFGLDQAYLRYLEDGRKYEADIVLIGFMSEDIYRNVNTFRPFYYSGTGVPLSKPRYIIRDEQLTLIPNKMRSLEDYSTLLQNPQELLPQFGLNDYYYQDRYTLSILDESKILDWSPTIRLIKIVKNKISNKLSKIKIIMGNRYNEDSEAFKLTTEVFSNFYKEAIENNSLPIIVIFPNREDILQYKGHKSKRYSPLLSYFELKGYRYIDLMEALEPDGSNYETKQLILRHYTPFANRLVAKHILTYMKNNNLGKVP